MNYYILALVLTVVILVISLIAWAVCNRDGRSKYIYASLIVVLIFAIIGVAFADNINRAKIKQDKICNAYCECQVTGDCDYTFDYNDVEKCDCEGR